MKKFISQGVLLFSNLVFIGLVWAQETAQVVAPAAAEPAVTQPPQNMQEAAKHQISTAKELINVIIEFLVKYFFQVLGGIIVLVLGWMVARYIGNLIFKFLAKKQVDITVSKFIVGAIRILVIGFAVIVALGKFGIEIAPLIAGISVVGFGTSFALQGPLSNYAAGISLIFSKPFKVGQIIEVAGVMGEVVDIKLAKTELKTVDGTSITVPNKDIVGEIIQNYSDFKAVKIKVGVSYKADPQKAIEVIRQILQQEDRLAKNVKHQVGIAEFGDSSINLVARTCCKQDQYYDVLFDINKKIYAEFARQKIEIPYPQREVRMLNS